MAEHTAEQIAEHIAEHVAERIAAHTVEHAAERIAERIAAHTVEHAAECMAERIAERIAAHTVEHAAECMAERMAEHTQLSMQQSASQNAHTRTQGMSVVLAQGFWALEVVSPQSGRIFVAQHGWLVVWKVSGARAQPEHIETSPRSSRPGDGRSAERGCADGSGCVGEPRGGVDHADR